MRFISTGSTTARALAVLKHIVPIYSQPVSKKKQQITTFLLKNI